MEPQKSTTPPPADITLRCPSFPTRRRKKDHGRAEALLLAAYVLGVRMQPLGGAAAEAAAGAEDDEEEQLSEEEDE